MTRMLFDYTANSQASTASWLVTGVLISYERVTGYFDIESCRVQYISDVYLVCGFGGVFRQGSSSCIAVNRCLCGPTLFSNAP